MTVVAFDTETRGLRWFDPVEQAFLASWADADGEYCADLSDETQAARFLAALEAADELVCHNLSFDVHQVQATLGWDALESGKVLHDTDLMSRVMYPEGQRKGERGGHGLKNLAKTYLTEDAQRAEEVLEELAQSIGTKLKSTGGFYDVWRAYPDQLEHYAKLDARYTYDLFQKFQADLDGAAETYELERRCAPVLIRAEQRGVRVDQAKVQALKQEYEEKQNGAHQALVEVLGEEALGGKGSEEVLLASLEGLGVPLHRKTDSGKLATNQFALQEFEDDFPILQTLAEYRTASKFLTTYIDPMLDRDVVHPSFMQCGAWTGRMSCRSPNMQNIPKRAGKEVREMFIPRDGYSFVVCDYDSIEVRLLAHYLNSEDYKALIRDGHDPHSWMSAQIHGGTIEDYAKDGPNDQIRSVSKNTLFAIVYGAGAPRVADMNKIDRKAAKALISKIKSSLPRYYKLNSRVKNKVKTSGYVTTLFGRKNPVKRDKAYVGLNALIQGSAADIMKQGLINADAVLEPLGGVPILVVHDEVVVEVPSENAAEALRLTTEALEAAYDLDPPLKVTGSVVTTNYADA